MIGIIILILFISLKENVNYNSNTGLLLPELLQILIFITGDFII